MNDLSGFYLASSADSDGMELVAPFLFSVDIRIRKSGEKHVTPSYVTVKLR